MKDEFQIHGRDSFNEIVTRADTLSRFRIAEESSSALDLPGAILLFGL